MIVNVEKTTGRVADVNQMKDPRFFDNLEYPDGTIPDADDPRFYNRQQDGTIVRRPQAELEADFENVLARRLRQDFAALAGELVNDVQALPAGPQKQILVKVLQLIRLLAKLVRME